jgi:hypothetical protein
MNWYLKSISNSHKDKTIAGLTDLGNFVVGKFHSVLPDFSRSHIFVIKDDSGQMQSIKSTNVRQIRNLSKTKEPDIHNVKANFCGHLIEGTTPELQKGIIHTRIMTTKEPYTQKKMLVIVPSTHIVNEDK